MTYFYIISFIILSGFYLIGRKVIVNSHLTMGTFVHYSLCFSQINFSCTRVIVTFNCQLLPLPTNTANRTSIQLLKLVWRLLIIRTIQQVNTTPSAVYRYSLFRQISLVCSNLLSDVGSQNRIKYQTVLRLVLQSLKKLLWNNLFCVHLRLCYTSQ